MKIALIGATGLVGRTFLKVMKERNFPMTALIPVASTASHGKKIEFRGKEFEICSIEDALNSNPDVAFFTAGGEISREWALRFAARDILVVDNSSTWRMHPEVPLIIPEVNGSVLRANHRLIANPNCSTIQLLMVCNPLHQKYRIQRMVISTYQSVSGSGQKAMDQLSSERDGRHTGDKVYPHPIDLNCLPHCGAFDENGNTEEELKLIRETGKILDPTIKISATAVRVPVIGGHSESVNLQFGEEFDMHELRQTLNNCLGLIVLDDPDVNQYPMPLLAAEKDEVFVGRLRRDSSVKNGLNLWIVADNLRKGAATNAIQIAEFYFQEKLNR